jgi:hypothetical protein
MNHAVWGINQADLGMGYRIDWMFPRTHQDGPLTSTRIFSMIWGRCASPPSEIKQVFEKVSSPEDDVVRRIAFCITVGRAWVAMSSSMTQ